MMSQHYHPLRVEVRFLEEDKPASFGEVCWPVAGARLSWFYQFGMLVSFGYELGAEEVSFFVVVHFLFFVMASQFKHFHCAHTVPASYASLDKSHQFMMHFLFPHGDQPPIGYLFIHIELFMIIVPIVQFNPFGRVALKYFDFTIIVFHDHGYVIVLTVGYCSLELAA
jgi:hypothetical protein